MEWQDSPQTAGTAIVGTVAVANGGTGSTTAAGARTNLGAIANGDSPSFGTVSVSEEAYDATGWNSDLTVPTKNAVRDKIESLVIPVASDVAYDAGTWNSNTDVPTKNTVRDKFESLVIPVASDVAYDETTWNANTDVPTKNAVRDKFSSIDATLTAIPTLAAGTYTPTLTNTTNIDSSTAFQAQYLRVGATVTVSGKVEIDTTASTTQTRLGISLPVASNFGATEDLAGLHSNSPGLGGIVYADTANDRAVLEFTEGAAGVETYYFHFTYQVI